MILFTLVVVSLRSDKSYFLIFGIFSFSENMASWNPFGQSYSIFPHQTGKNSCIFITEAENFLFFLNFFRLAIRIFLSVRSFFSLRIGRSVLGSQFSLSSLFYTYMCRCVLASIQQPPSLKQNLFLIRREGSLEQVKFVF